MKIDIKKLRAEEKLKLCMGSDFWSNYNLDGKIYKFVVSDGPVGLRQPVNRNTEVQNDCIKSVAYPSIQVLSQTFNRKIANKMGKSLANDCIDQNVDVLLAPGVNIKRTPLNGRNFEYFSEDPVVAGILATEYIKGVQGEHVSTCLKHFCCNNSEYSRHWNSMEVDERTLREIYLLPFEIVCKNANPHSIMCSYNLLNGVRMSENKVLYNLLRNEFNFNGIIISDWSAVKNSLNSIYAGLDLEMPYCKENLEKSLEDLEKGNLDEEKLDECAQRVVNFANMLEREKALQKVNMTIEERRKVAQNIEEEGIVLLKNNGVLPIKNGSVTVTGAPSKNNYYGDGSAKVYPEIIPDTLETALKNLGIDAKFSESIYYTIGDQSAVWNEKEAVYQSAKSDYTILCVGNPSSEEGEDRDRQNLKLSNEEVEAIHNFRRVADKLIVVVYAGSSIEMSDWIDEVDGLLWAGYPGEMGQNAVANVITGRINPSGKLTETFPLKLDDVPAVNTYRDEACTLYAEGLNVGYRYFDTYNKEVLFPFGFGLSYTTFKYENLALKEEKDNVKISFDIENTGDFDGGEVAQIYVRELTKEVYRPFKELKNFEKVFIEKGKKAHLEMCLTKRDFSYWSQNDKMWKFKPGIFEIMVGSHSRDIRLKKKIELM